MKATMIFGVVAALLIASPFLADVSAQDGTGYDVEITQLQVQDSQGVEIIECDGCTSSMLMLTAEMKNRLPAPKSFVIYLEVRDLATGYTIYNEFGTGTLSPEGLTKVGISWTPAHAGNYELRSFVFDNLQNTERMSGIATAPIVVS